MAVAKLKLQIDQGATFRRRLTWQTGTPPVAVDLSGWSARMQIRPTIGSDQVLATLTTDNGGITLGGAAGTIDLYLAASATAGYGWQNGVYDLELVAPGADGDVTRLLGGSVQVTPEVAR